MGTISLEHKINLITGKTLVPQIDYTIKHESVLDERGIPVSFQQVIHTWLNTTIPQPTKEELDDRNFR